MSLGKFVDFAENRAFFEDFGQRLSELRKDRGITQVQLAEATGYSQQQVQAFEKGRRRMPLSVLPVVVEVLGVSYEELLGVEKRPLAKGKRGPPSKLEKQIERLSKLSRNEQRFVSKMIEAALQQAGV